MAYISMEQDSNSSMSDKDKKMSESFEFAKDDEKNESKEKKKKAKQLPKRSLFIEKAGAKDSAEQATEKSTADQWLERQRKQKEQQENILKALLSADAAGENATSDVKETDDVKPAPKDYLNAPSDTEATAESSSDDKEKESSSTQAVPKAAGAATTSSPPIRPISSSPSVSSASASPSFGVSNFNTVSPPPNFISADALNADPNASKMNEFYYRRKNTGKVILAGLLGYAVGRRGGRKRTEARLQPEIEESKKDIKALEQKLEQSEQADREEATQESPAAAVSEVFAAAAAPIIEAVEPPEKPAAAVASSEKPKQPRDIPAETIAQEVEEIEAQREQFAEKLVPDEPEPAANTPAESAPAQPSYENVGLQASTQPAAETVSAPETTPDLERPKKPTESSPAEIEIPKDIQAMTMPELLQVAESIDTGSGSLKDLYERKRIDAVNLRKVVAEHAAGHNYKEFLHKSLEAEEMKRELRSEIKVGDATPTDASAFSSSAAVSSGADDSVAADTEDAVATPTQSVVEENIQPSVSGLELTQNDPGVQSRSALNKPQETVEYVKISTPVAIVSGILVGGVFALLVLLFSGSL